MFQIVFLTYFHQVIYLLVLFAFLINMSQSQRGRGSSSTSSSSFSSSSSFGRSSFGRSSYNNYYSYGPTNPLVTVYVICGFFGLAFCSGGLIFTAMKIRQWRKSKQYLREFERLKTLKNVVCARVLNLNQFEQIKCQFIDLIHNSNSVFCYVQSGQTTNITNTTIKTSHEEDFLQKIELAGHDSLGQWTAQGYLLTNSTGPFVWWMKQYKDKQSAGQTGNCQFLIYESTAFSPNNWVGRWYYECDQFDKDYSENWSLSINPSLDNKFERKISYQNLNNFKQNLNNDYKNENAPVRENNSFSNPIRLLGRKLKQQQQKRHLLN